MPYSLSGPKKKNAEKYYVVRRMTCKCWELFVGQQRLNKVQEVGFHDSDSS